MDEKFLYHIWKFKLFNTLNLKTTTDEVIEILKPGNLQPDSGPDFFNAQIKINKTLWAGNIEIDMYGSDWVKHKHHKDAAYHKIILHVVYEVDKPIVHNLPVLELKNYIPDSVLKNYEELKNESSSFPCHKEIAKVESIVINSWLERVLTERLEKKTSEINNALQLNKNNWEETFYHFLAKNFGFKTNAIPFELLAKSIPLVAFAKHKNSLLSIEAMLFGSAGMLDINCNDEYFLLLKKEYHFLRGKFNLISIDKSLWKFLRLRPANFPTIRISQFAALLHNSTHLFSKILEIKKPNDLHELLNISASAYWNNHYTFGKESGNSVKDLGANAINLIVINTVVAFLFLYGKTHYNMHYINRAFSFLETLSSEKNIITKKYTSADLQISNAWRSQAVIELYKNYCSSKKCLDCAIGLKILNKD